MVGGICCFLLAAAIAPVVGIALIVGGVVAAGSANWTRDAMNVSY